MWKVHVERSQFFVFFFHLVCDLCNYNDFIISDYIFNPFNNRNRLYNKLTDLYKMRSEFL